MCVLNSQYRVNGSKETAYERDDSDNPGDYPLGHFEQLIADRNSSLLQWRFRDYCRKQLTLYLTPRRAGTGRRLEVSSASCIRWSPAPFNGALFRQLTLLKPLLLGQ